MLMSLSLDLYVLGGSGLLLLLYSILRRARSQSRVGLTRVKSKEEMAANLRIAVIVVALILAVLHPSVDAFGR